MSRKEVRTPAVHAILTMAAIKDAVRVFEDGATNVIDALDAVCVAVDAYKACVRPVRGVA